MSLSAILASHHSPELLFRILAPPIVAYKMWHDSQTGSAISPLNHLSSLGNFSTELARVRCDANTTPDPVDLRPSRSGWVRS